MPHVSVKLHPGKTEEQKRQLADKIAEDVMTLLGSSAESVSVAFEEVSPAAWMSDVYEPEIAGRAETLYRKPGYGSLA